MIPAEDRTEQLLKRIEQAIYQLQREQSAGGSQTTAREMPEISVSANLRVEDGLEVFLRPMSPVVIGVLTLDVNATGLIRPTESEHWALHAVYHTQSCQLDRVYNDTDSIDGFLTNANAGVIIGWDLLLRHDYYIRVKNTGSATGVFVYEARRLNL